MKATSSVLLMLIIERNSFCRLQERLGFLTTQPPAAKAPVAWHKHTHRLAAADGADRVHICDASAAASTSGRPPSPTGLPAKLALYHDFQQQVLSSEPDYHAQFSHSIIL